MTDQFQDAATKIFVEAGVDPVTHADLFSQTQEILAMSMARMSVGMGLSYKRVELYEEQKRSLVQDLLNMKADGQIV